MVVVLIIGILAAIALPQYNKAVFKSRFATLYATTNALAVAEEAHYLENGHYTTDIEELVVEVPIMSDSKTKFTVWNNSNADNWALTGNYDGVIAYLVWPKHSKVRTDKRVCRAYLNKPMTETAKSICNSMKDPNHTVFKHDLYWEWYIN